MCEWPLSAAAGKALVSEIWAPWLSKSEARLMSSRSAAAVVMALVESAMRWLELGSALWDNNRWTKSYCCYRSP